MLDNEESEFSYLDDDQVVLRVVLKIFIGVSCEGAICFGLIFTIFFCILNELINTLDLFFDPRLNHLITFKILIGLLKLCKLFIDSIESL